MGRFFQMDHLGRGTVYAAITHVGNWGIHQHHGKLIEQFGLKSFVIFLCGFAKAVKQSVYQCVYTLIVEYCLMYEGWCRGSLFSGSAGQWPMVCSAYNARLRPEKRVNLGYFRHINFFLKIRQETQKVLLKKDRNRSDFRCTPLGNRNPH